MFAEHERKEQGPVIKSSRGKVRDRVSSDCHVHVTSSWVQPRPRIRGSNSKKGWSMTYDVPDRIDPLSQSQAMTLPYDIPALGYRCRCQSRSRSRSRCARLDVEAEVEVEGPLDLRSVHYNPRSGNNLSQEVCLLSARRSGEAE